MQTAPNPFAAGSLDRWGVAAHARLAPSAAGRWVRCPGSVILSEAYPETEETQEAQEGTAAHWAATELAAGRMVAEGQISPDGWVLDEDQIEGAELFVAHIPPSVRILAHIEKRLSMREGRGFIHAYNWGTPDLWALDVACKIVYLYDYKYGHGLVDVFECWQLIDYAAGVMNAAPIVDDTWTFEFGIVQPRAFHRDGHVRRWRVSVAELRKYWFTLQTAAEEAMSPDPSLVPGEHCRHCPARHACPALHNEVSQIAPRLERAVALELPDNALGFELRQLYHMQRLLNARVSGLEVEAEARIKSGKPIPWMALESKPGREKWTVDAAMVLELGKAAGVDLSKPPQPVTPRQARNAGVPDEMVKAFAKRGNTALKLSVINSREVRRIFIDGVVNKS